MRVMTTVQVTSDNTGRQSVDFFARVGATTDIAVRVWQGNNPMDLTAGTLDIRLAKGPDEYSDRAETQMTATKVNASQGTLRLGLPADHRNRPGDYYYQLDYDEGTVVTELLSGKLCIGEELPGP